MAGFKIPPPPVGTQDQGVWSAWYVGVADAISRLSKELKWTSLDFTGSNLTSIVTKNHNDLSSKQGGSGTEYYHLTAAQHTTIGSGLSVTITTAPVTGGGTTGSMTFTNGILTAQTPAT